MAINRFYTPTRKDVSFQMYTPMEWQPNMELWGKVLGQKQQELNLIRDLRTPQHISESKDAVETQMGKIRDSRDKIVDAYKNGNLAAGLQLQSELVGEVKRAVQPGGWFAEEESLYKKAQKVIADQDELLKDDPVHWKQAARAAIKTKGSTIDADGNYVVGSVNSPTWGKYQDITKDILEQLNGMKGDRGTYIYDDQKGFMVIGETIEQLTEKEVLEAAESILNQPKYRQQLRVEAGLLGYTQDTIKTSTETFINGLKDSIADGKTKEVQQMLLTAGYYKGAVDGTNNTDLQNAISEYEKDLLARDPNAIAYNEIKSNYLKPVVKKLGYKYVDKTFKFNTLAVGKALKDYEKELDDPYTAVETSVYTKNSGLPDWDIKINLNTGFVTSFTNEAGEVIPLSGGVDFKDYLNTRAQEENPLIYQVYQSLKSQVDGMSSTEAYKFIKTKYEEKKEQLSSTTDIMYAYNNDLREEKTESYLGTLLGSGDNQTARMGLVKDLGAWIIEPGKPPRKGTVDDLVKATAGQTRVWGDAKSYTKFLKNATLLGEIRPDNEWLIGGIQGVYIDKKHPNKRVTFYIPDPDRTHHPYQGEFHHISQAALKGGVEKTTPIQSTLPGWDQKYGKIYSMGVDVYTLDQLKEQRADILRNRASGNFTQVDQEKLNDINSQIEKIKKDPYLNKFETRIGHMYNGNNQPIYKDDGSILTADEYRLLLKDYYEPR